MPFFFPYGHSSSSFICIRNKKKKTRKEIELVRTRKRYYTAIVFSFFFCGFFSEIIQLDGFGIMHRPTHTQLVLSLLYHFFTASRTWSALSCYLLLFGIYGCLYLHNVLLIAAILYYFKIIIAHVSLLTRLKSYIQYICITHIQNSMLQ